DEAGWRAHSITAADVRPEVATIAPAISIKTRVGILPGVAAARPSSGRAEPGIGTPGLPGGTSCDFVSANQTAIWVREWDPSLFRICSTWLSAVRSEMKSLAAISRLVRPSARSAATSVSRRVSGATCMRRLLQGLGMSIVLFVAYPVRANSLDLSVATVDAR